ncbi:MAG: DUF58 domain-containing protein [Porticoccaceae bacterium]|nr:DUF58 domain-containing protein [Porticoccaceae bacterium]|tara:strand:- start:1269 stop:2204 length:936 start_codon:yes stop_codon:yes gene_type:complete
MIVTEEVENPAIASIASMIRLRHAARELVGFPNSPARQVVSGSHKSRIRGRGMDFEEVRLYQAGDDIRTIDWRVTARSQNTYTKIFTEEREKPLLVITDLRATMFFGSQRLKSVAASEVSAALAWAALSSNDRLGGIVFGQEKTANIKPRRSHHSVLKYIQSLNTFSAELLKPREDYYTMEDILEETQRFVMPDSTLFIVSDFLDFDEQSYHLLFKLVRHSKVYFCRVFDPIERELPPPGLYAVTDGNYRALLNTNGKTLRASYRSTYEEHVKYLQKISEKLRVGLISLDCSMDIMQVLGSAFGKHCRQKK